MHTFNPSALLARLTSLPGEARVAFAAATATRQLSNIERASRDPEAGVNPELREIVHQIWVVMDTGILDHQRWQLLLERVLQFLDGPSEELVTENPYLEDAITSVAYTIRCLQTLDAQDAIWAAQRALDAVDQAAIRILKVEPGTPEAEKAIRSHEVVQRELGRQQRDLELLLAGDIAGVMLTASREELFSEDDWSAANQSSEM